MGGNAKSDKKAMLQAWREGQRAEARAKFPLPDETLAKFFADLDAMCESEGCEHTYRLSKSVALAMALDDATTHALLAWCRENGGYCDCEITMNTHQAWEESRARS